MSQGSYTNPFGFSNKYYDLLYEHKNYALETAYVSRLIRQYNPKAKQLIELGSGTGNHARFFCNLGYEITGIELSTEMVAVSKSKSIAGFTVLHNDMTSFELDKKFDAAVSLFHVISYLTEDEKIISCFKQIAKHLNPKGVFVFDVWYTPAVCSEPPQRRVKRMEDDFVKITRIAEPVVFYENTVNVHYEWVVDKKTDNGNEVFNEVHSMRHFDTAEIKSLAETSGFELLKAEEFLTAKKPGADTFGVCYILQKND